MQLRDAKTSQCVFVGSPFECVVVAGEIGRDEVLFDDAGEGFDPDSVMKAYEENVAGHEDVSKSTSIDKADRDVAAKIAKTAKAELADAKKQTEKTRKAIDAARAGLE